MATQEFKTALTNAKFPFLYSRASRGVLQPGLDVVNRTNGAFVGTPDSLDWNTVFVQFMENVLPIAEGILAVNTSDVADPFVGPVTDFDQLITLRDAVENNYLFSPARGKNYVYNETTKVWTSLSSFAWGGTKNLVTRAYVNGRTFICYEGDRLIEYNPGVPSFTTLALILPGGLTMANIRGCFGASNYLGLFTDTEILWCSLLNILDFNDPTVGKSGRQIPIDLKGQINCVVPISGGMIIYTTRNAVAAFFTNNADTPFSFREVQNSGGVASYEQVTSEANQAQHYTYGTSGVQLVTLQNAETILPDCADFLSSRMYDFWNATTKKVEEFAVVNFLEVKLQYLGNRYLVISYAKLNGQFQLALFYDDVLKRWGKVRVNHVDVSLLPNNVVNNLALTWDQLVGTWDQYTQNYDALTQSYGTLVPSRTGFGFLQNTGALKILLTDPGFNSGKGTAIIGRVQIVRGRMVTFSSCKLDNLKVASSPTVTILGSTPGTGMRRDSIYVPTEYPLGENTMKLYNGRATFENFDVAIEGDFSLTSCILGTVINGSR